MKQKDAGDCHRNDELFWHVCSYFAARYRAYKQAMDEKDNVEEYKYKQYGQKETQEELDVIEYEQHFPSYQRNFEEFITRNVLEGKVIF